MTELLHGTDVPSDAELISRVRGGDLAAYGDLFERHVTAARRLSRQLVRGPDADDLVSDAFAKVMGVLQGGGGPDVAFRAYLLTAVRRLHIDRVRAQARLTTTDDMEAFDPGVPFQDTAVAGFESSAAASAFASLPERWQLVLWHLEVEGQKPADIAPLLGMSANSVSALAYRAREGLRQAFLTAHLNDTADGDCRWVNEHLGGYVRGGLSKRDTGKVKEHLDHCRSCAALYLELTEVNSNLSAIVAPLLLGSAAAGYVASAGGGAAGGVVALIGRTKDAVSGNLGAVAAGAAAVAAATVVAIVAINANQGHNDQPAAAGLPTSSPSSRADAGSPSPTAGPTPSPAATKPSQTNQTVTSANVSLSGAHISGGAVVLAVDGLPDTLTSVRVRLTSASGLTTFAPGGDNCSVSPSAPTVASCGTSSGGAGASVLVLAPSHYEATLPLAYPDDLQSDRLTVRVEVPGVDDPSTANNQVTLDFTPPGRPATPLPTTPNTPTTRARTADLHLAASADGDHVVDLRVKGVPAQPTTLRFHVGGSGVTPSSAPKGCSLEGATVTCTGVTNSFSGATRVSYDDAKAPVDVSVRVDAVGVDEQDPSDNTAKVRLGKAPTPSVDLGISVVDAPGGGTGLFRATVVGLPSGYRGPLSFKVTTDNPAVELEGIPTGCSYGSDHTIVSCPAPADGGAWSGILDLDLHKLSASQTVQVTIAVALPGYDESHPADNTVTFRIGLRGILGSIVRSLLAQPVLATR